MHQNLWESTQTFVSNTERMNRKIRFEHVLLLFFCCFSVVCRFEHDCKFKYVVSSPFVANICGENDWVRVVLDESMMMMMTLIRVI